MPATSVRVTADDLEWLRPLAESEHRSVANMLHVLLHEARDRRQAIAHNPTWGDHPGSAEKAAARRRVRA